MKTTSHWATPAALSWLSQVLLERFGHSFAIQFLEPNKLALLLPGSEERILFDTDGAMFSRSDSDLPLTVWNASGEGWQALLGTPLPAPGAVELSLPLIEPIKHGYHLHYDCLGLAYWMLARQEEVGRQDLDRHDRFPAASSHAFKHGYLERPIVDEWLDILRQIIERLWPNIQLKPHRFQMLVSHDVDTPTRYGFLKPTQFLRRVAADVMKRRDVTIAARVRLKTREELHPQDPYNTFDWVMDVSERYSLVSAFYFICGRTDPSKDAFYELEHPAIRSLLRRIHGRGHEIGLHPSYNTYREPELLKCEAQRLRRVCDQEGIRQAAWGGRMHYLRWSQPITMRAWETAEMKYDSTLGYADHAGFRCGTCFEYPAFDPVAGERLNLRIRPLVAMESTIMSSQYMGLGASDEALAKFHQYKQACKAAKGNFTLLWHNSELRGDVERQLYEAVLRI